MALTYGGKRKPGGMGPRTPLDPLEQQLTDRIAAVLRALRNSTDVDAYVRAIQSLDPDALERLLVRVEMGALGARIEETLRNVVVTGGSAEGQRIIRETPRVPSPFEALQYPGRVLPSGIIVPPGLAPPPDVEFTVATQRPDLFEYVDRRATEYARTRAANLVVQVDSANRLAIRRVIHESFTQPATADQTARKLRSMVGLHTRWARAVMNFDDVNYRRFLKDGMTQEAARARADVLTKRYSDRLIRRRAEMIARTEIQQAQNWGRQAAWDGGSKAGYVDMASMKEWRTAPMGSQYGPPCPICTELRGTRVPYNGTFANGYEMPPAHPHCFVAGTIVDGPRVTGSTARWFEGEVVELGLSEGPGLTGTPNHPVLTTRGWVALGEIREGDEVIRNAGLQRAAASVSPHDDQHPARIENVADAVGRAGGVPSREVPVAGPDFHGDGAGSEVAVVRADRLLGDHLAPEVEEPSCEHRLAPAAVGALRLDAGGDPLAMERALLGASDGGMGGLGVGAALLRGASGGHDAVRVAEPSGLGASVPQDANDDVPARPESVRERLHRLAPEVSLSDLFRCGVDVVTSVVRRAFAGHVYNLETVDGWYSANGIVVHNCRCTAVLVPPSRGLTGQPSQDMDSWLTELDALDAESIAEYDAVRKHGDPSRPGYAQLHPTGRHSVTSQKDRVANALRTGEAMGLGWPCPPEIKAAFDQAVKDADTEYDMNPAGARMFRASHDALHDEARRFAIEAGMPGDDAPHGDMSSADIYADAIVNRARMVRRQQDAYQSDEDNDVDDAGSATLLDVRKGGVVLVAVHPDTALQIVADGRIKTQFETGGSNGALDPDYRAVQETAVFDHHPASPVRTVYGYVASEDMGIDPRTAGPSQYGEARLEMVPSVRAVSSMTAGDTLGYNSTPIPMTGEIPDGDRGVHAAMGRVNIPGYSRDVNEELRYQSVDEWTQEQDNYFEAQIHADVTTEMIAKVHWPRRLYDSSMPSDRARALFEAEGIEFEEYDPDDYAY